MCAHENLHPLKANYYKEIAINPREKVIVNLLRVMGGWVVVLVLESSY